MKSGVSATRKGMRAAEPRLEAAEVARVEVRRVGRVEGAPQRRVHGGSFVARAARGPTARSGRPGSRERADRLRSSVRQPAGAVTVLASLLVIGCRARALTAARGHHHRRRARHSPPSAAAQPAAAGRGARRAMPRDARHAAADAQPGRWVRRLTGSGPEPREDPARAPRRLARHARS